MNNNLLQDALNVVNELIHKQLHIELDVKDRALYELAELIGSYRMARSRKITILSCCMLISVGIRKHRKLQLGDNERLARSILDGDYLIGMIYRLAVSRKEQKLLVKLSPIYKRAQLKAIDGSDVKGVAAELKREVKDYLDQYSA